MEGIDLKPIKINKIALITVIAIGFVSNAFAACDNLEKLTGKTVRCTEPVKVIELDADSVKKEIEIKAALVATKERELASFVTSYTKEINDLNFAIADLEKTLDDAKLIGVEPTK